MRMMKIAAMAAAIGSGTALMAASANAEQVASVQSCLNLAAQVRTALDSNPQSANYEAAMKERNYGLSFCNNGFYAKGVAHYSRALEILGVPQKS